MDLNELIVKETIDSSIMSKHNTRFHGLIFGNNDSL